MIVIGITGHPVAGKDTIGDYLVTKGFKKYTFGDILREEMKLLNLPVDRSSMSKFSTERKAELGNDYLCYVMLKKISGDTVTPGVRSTEEVRTFRKELGQKFNLFVVEAPIEKRYEWSKERGKEGDNVTFEEFKRIEDQERNGSTGSQEVDKVIEMADFIIQNDGTKEDLYKKVDDLISSFK